MSSVYFFTNLTGLQPQTVQQRYGPVDGQEDSRYRVTSRFTSTAMQKVYAVCGGKVFAQQVGGRINLVLRPTSQPVGIYAAVRYYIYKGLLATSLIDSTDANLIAPATKSDLTASIHKSQLLRNTARKLTGPSAPKAAISAVGLHRTAAAAAPAKLLDADFIDQVFLTLDADEYPTVNDGAVLGEFDRAGFGFEIILDAIGEGPRVDALRNNETIIRALTSPVTDADQFRAADRREQILDYIDPCAFFASFFFDGVMVKTQAADTKFTPKRRDGLVSAVLSNFATRDTVYVDIRNEHNHSLNYYREYGSSATAPAQFQVEIDGGGSALIDYQSHGWPIFTIPTASFTGTEANKPGIAILRLPGGANTKPLAHRGQGYFYTGFRKTNHTPSTKETLRPNIFLESDGFTVTIAFSIPRLADLSVIPGYINLRYLKRIGAPAPVTPPAASIAIEARHFFDNLFELTRLLDGNNLRIPLSTDDVTVWAVTGATSFVDATSGYGPPYMVKVGVGRDPSNVYFFACMEQVPLATGSSNAPLLPPELVVPHKTNIEFNYIEIVDSNNVSRPVLSHNGLPDGVVESSSDGSLNIDASSMILLALDKDELAAVATAASSFDPALDKRLVLRNTTTFPDNVGNTAGTEYSLFVTGYKLGTHAVVSESDTNLKVRNLDAKPRLFSTKDAALNFNGLRGIEQNLKHFTRSRTVLDVNWGLRENPDATAPEAGRSQGRVLEVEILGKVVGTDINWYMVRLPRTIDATLSENTRCWIGRGDGFYPVASFEKFITDLQRLNDELDAQQDAQQTPLDTLRERITRLREMTVKFIDNPNDLFKPHISLSNMFDEVIHASPTTPPAVQNLNDIAYLPGFDEPAKDGTGTTYTLTTAMQIFRDYMGVEFGPPGNGIIVDLHHLFVGLDVLFHVDTNRTIDASRMFVNSTLSSAASHFLSDYPIGNNVDTATWAGDIGAAPPDWKVNKDDKYKDRLDNDKSLTPAERGERLLDHYYKTRAGDADLYPDVFTHLLQQQMQERLNRKPTFRNVAAALYSFNRQLTAEGDQAAFRTFIRYVKLDANKPFGTQQTAVNGMKDAVRLFSGFWFIRDNPDDVLLSFVIDIEPKQQALWPVADAFTTAFVFWLEQHK
jgi:hypothetical protein